MEISLGDDLIPGRLPMMTQRYQLITVVQTLSEEILEARKDKDRREQLGGGVEYELGLALVASIGMCWQGTPLGCRSLRDHRYDVVAYGESVMDALLMLGYEPAEVTRVGRITKDKILASLPTPEELEEAADFTGALEGQSTEGT